MSMRALRWTLWLAFLLTLPLPYAAIESGRIPGVQLALFAALMVPLACTDPGITTVSLAAIFAVQALGYGALLSLVARWLSARIPPSRRAAAATGIAVALLLLALVPIYVAPLSYGPLPTNWLGLWR